MIRASQPGPSGVFAQIRRWSSRDLLEVMPVGRRTIRLWLAVCALVIVGMGCYLDNLDIPFIYDDELLIRENRDIRTLWPPWETHFPPSEPGFARRPVTSISLALTLAMHGWNPVGWHMFSNTVHLLSALLLFGLLRRLLRDPILARDFGPDPTLPALVAASAWAAHPLLTHGVTYLTGRSDLLMAFFALLTLYGARRAWEASRPTGWRVVAIGAFLLGAGCKEPMVAVPFVLLLHDWTFSRLSLLEIWRRRGWFYPALTLALLMVTILYAYSLISMERSDPHGAFVPSVWTYAISQPKVYFFFLRQLLWPDGLSLAHQWPFATLSESWPWIVAWILSVGGVLHGAAHRRPWAFPALSFLLLLAPLHSFLPVVLHFPIEYRAYLPSVGPAALAVLAGFRLFRRWEAWRRTKGLGVGSGLISPRTFAPLAAVLLVGGLATRTAIYNRVYADPEAYWRNALEQSPDSLHIIMNWTTVLVKQHRMEEALPYLERVLRPTERDLVGRRDLGTAHHNMAVVLGNLGRFEESERHYRVALELQPGNIQAKIYLAGVLRELGELAEAVSLLKEVIEAVPDYHAAYVALAKTHQRQGRPDLALAVIEEALTKTELAQPVFAPVRAVMLQEARAAAAAYEEEQATMDAVAADHSGAIPDSEPVQEREGVPATTVSPPPPNAGSR